MATGRCILVPKCVDRPRVPDGPRPSNKRAYAWLFGLIAVYGAFLASIVTFPVILACRL